MQTGWLACMRLAALCAAGALGACQPAAVPAQAAADLPVVPVNGVGYIIFNATILPQTRDLFIADVDKLVNAGAREITIGMNSPGGRIDAAAEMVQYMDRLHTERGITFKAYNLGLVGSAASYVFLNAQARFTSARGAFLFHAAGVVSNGPISAEALREEAEKLDAYERVVRATLKAHTRLTDAEATTYVRRTVILNAEDARRDGVVDAVAEFSMPKEARAWAIAARRPSAATGPATPTPAPPAAPN